VGDLDNDGDLDLVVSNTDQAPTLLENRQAMTHHWVAVRVVAAAGNRFAIGAKVTISGGGTKQVREIRSGGSFLSQNDLRAYFGLGNYAGPVDVEIRMPGGRRWEWKQLPIDRLHVLSLAE
jgi:enediyne biosynthesis protein E4